MTRPILFLLVSVFLVLEGQTQIIIDNTVNEITAVEDILLGEGVVASNITFSGDQNQIGSFESNGSDLSISTGVILATGNCNLASSSEDDNPGPGGNNQGGMNSGGGNLDVGDDDLAVLSGQELHDAAILEFDFIPEGDSLSFKFIFASEEYPEFVNAGVNDAFGFFLSGPGLNGTFENNAVNLAVIPGTDNPISIDDINADTNSEFYIDNSTTNPDPNVIEYDGYTTLLTAKSEVECGETYHIKLVIADGGDTVWDSAVFLKASSFSSNQISIDLASDVGFLANDSTAYEGCSVPVINITRPEGIETTETIELTISGTAEMDIDYTGIQESLTLEPGQSELEISIEILEDNLDEPLETIVISFESSTQCSNEPTVQVLTIYLTDVPPILIETEDALTDCGNPVVISPVASGGVGELSIIWDDGSTDFDREVNPGTTTDYEFTITDECNRTNQGSIQVEVPIYEDIQIEEFPVFDDVTCGELIQLTAQASGGNEDLSYAWFEGNTLIGSEQSLDYVTQSSSNLTLVVTDGCQTSEEIDIEFNFNPISVEILGAEKICKGESTTLTSQINGGEGDINYIWTNSDSQSASISVSPIATTTYELTVNDNCGSTANSSFTLEVEDVQASFTCVEVGINTLELTNTSTENTSIEWDLGGFSTSAEQSVIFPNPDPYSFLTISLSATSEFGCADSTSKVLAPEPVVYIPNAFTPNNDGLNEVWFVEANALEEYRVIIFNRDGGVVFESTDISQAWNGSVNSGDYYVPDGIYNYVMTYRGFNTEAKVIRGHISVIR